VTEAVISFVKMLLSTFSIAIVSESQAIAIEETVLLRKNNRPLAKVANDRHNLAQIARNCRYQQLN
jgi:hypothetical protein